MNQIYIWQNLQPCSQVTWFSMCCLNLHSLDPISVVYAQTVMVKVKNEMTNKYRNLEVTSTIV